MKIYQNIACVITTLWLTTNVALADNKALHPSPEYAPQQVVKIVIEALQNNAQTDNDGGIATVFRFASPGNRSQTGPLTRFTRMIKGGFADMLEHTAAHYEPMEITSDTAVQAVCLEQPDSTEVCYAFQLGKQLSGEFEGIWMTEAVIPLGKSSRSGTGI